MNKLKIFTIIQASDRDLSTGLKRKSGKGERCIVWGIGGSSGWLDWEVIMRGKAAGNSMNYKDDMSMSMLTVWIFQEFSNAQILSENNFGHF